MTITDCLAALREQHPGASYRERNGAIYTDGPDGRWYGIYSTTLLGPDVYSTTRDGRTVLPVLTDTDFVQRAVAS